MLVVRQCNARRLHLDLASVIHGISQHRACALLLIASPAMSMQVPQTGPTPLTLRSGAQAALTERLPLPSRLRRLAHASCRSALSQLHPCQCTGMFCHSSSAGRCLLPVGQATLQVCACMQVLAQKLRLASGLDFRAVAASTPGFVGADLAALTQEAAALAVQRIFGQLEAQGQSQLVRTPSALHPLSIFKFTILSLVPVSSAAGNSKDLLMVRGFSGQH